jgi:hypothetical protein
MIELTFVACTDRDQWFAKELFYMKAKIYYAASVGVRTKNVKELALALEGNTTLPITSPTDLANLQETFDELCQGCYDADHTG